MQTRMSGECFFKLHMLHMALGVGGGQRGRGVGGFACLARRQLTAQLDIVEHSETPPTPPASQRVTLGSFPQ